MHNTHAHFYGAMERSQASYDFISRSLITQHSRDRGGRRDWCPPLQMRDVQTQTFSLPPEISYASTGVCRLQRTGIPSYHRRRQQQMHSRMCRRACVDMSTVTDASANIRTFAQQCADAYVSVNASVCIHRSVHRNVLPSLRRFLLLSLANGRREGDRSWLSHRCLERQVGQFGSWNLTCVHCQRQATATKACNWARAVSWPSRWTLVSFIITGKLAGWSVHVYNTHSDFERGNYGENCAYYNRIFTVCVIRSCYGYFISGHSFESITGLCFISYLSFWS